MADRDHWNVQPLRKLEADVPLPYTLEAVTDAQIAVEIGIGCTITIAPDGLVRNASGTPIFRIVPAAPREKDARG